MNYYILARSHQHGEWLTKKALEIFKFDRKPTILSLASPDQIRCILLGQRDFIVIRDQPQERFPLDLEAIHARRFTYVTIHL